MSKVLIVDDERFIRKRLENALMSHYETRTAADGSECMEIAKSWMPDLILLDVEMPGQNGYEVCDTLKGDEETKAIPVVFLSANNSTRERMLGYEMGAADYLAKSLEEDELTAKLKGLAEANQQNTMLKREASSATQTALEAMATSAELGMALRHVQRSQLAPDHDALAVYLLGFAMDLNLNVVFTFKTRKGQLFYTTSKTSNVTPLEKEILTLLHGKERFTDFGCRTNISYPYASILVKNMPLDDRSRYGRLKDVLPFVIEATDARLRLLDVEQVLREQNNDLLVAIEEIKKSAANVGRSVVHQQTAISQVTTDMMSQVALELPKWGLEEDQEQYVCDLIEKASSRLRDTLDQHTETAGALNQTVTMLERVTEGHSVIINETLMIADTDSDPLGDVELF